MDLVKRSLKIIKDLQLKNGGILATFKNDAYPYVYPRDGVIMTKALNTHGFYKNSEKFYYFLKSLKYRLAQRFHGFGFGEYLPYVTQRGESDIFGLAIHGIWDTFSLSSNSKFLEDMWPFVKKCVRPIDAVTRDGLVIGRRSIHEFIMLECGHEIWANSACCRGLYDASEIARSLGKYREAREWKLKADNLKKNILRKLFDRKNKVFIKVIRRLGTLKERVSAPDIAQLSPFYFDIVESNHILENTLRMLRKTIWHKKLGGFLRFEPFKICRNWHWYTGGDGPFTMFTMIAAKFFKQVGDKKNFEECLDWIYKVPTKEGYFPERFSLRKDYEVWKRNEWEFSERILNGIKRAESLKPPIKDVVYWATPIGWSHAEYILLNDFISKS